MPMAAGDGAKVTNGRVYGGNRSSKRSDRKSGRK